MFKASIKVLRKREILDPQGKAIEKGINLLGYSNVSNVRIDKMIELEIDSTSKEEAKIIVEKVCNELLANPHLENYSYVIEEI